MNNLKLEFNDLKIRIFHFNFVQVNCYVIYDNTNEAVIIDPGNFSENETFSMLNFIEKENLTVKYLLITHPHFDHTFGLSTLKKSLKSNIVLHKEGLPVYNETPNYLKSFNLEIKPLLEEPDIFITDGDSISFGNQKLTVLYTPGHCDGSVCYYDEKNKILFSGDVIFEESIGRTDLPTGNHELLIDSIISKILILPNETVILSGHGNSTTIEHEKTHNSYLK